MPDLIEVISALAKSILRAIKGLFRGEELAYYRAAGDGQAFPTTESITGFKFKLVGDWTVLQVTTGDLG